MTSADVVQPGSPATRRRGTTSAAGPEGAVLVAASHRGRAQAEAVRHVAAVVADLDDPVVRVDEDDLRLEGPRLVVVHRGIRDDDDGVAGGDQPRRGAVDAHDAGAPLPLDRVGGQPVAVVDVNDVDLFARQQARGVHEVAVDRQGPDVVQVGLRHRGPVDLGVEHEALHGHVPRGRWSAVGQVALDSTSEKTSSAPPPGPTVIGRLSMSRVVPTRPATASSASPRYHSGTSSSVAGWTSTR
jgi:hypothetical protein